MSREYSEKTILRITREVARGGMGTVSEAYVVGASGFEKRVAVKELLPVLCQEEQFVEMFAGEARLVADLVHENIIQIHQLNRHDDQYYIVMEYVHGLPLSTFIREHVGTERRLPVELAVFITSRIARGLAYAHSRRDPAGHPMNLVHRDVCPNNILITTEGLPKLGDFGIAKALNADVSSLMGKGGYMAPEQAWQKDVDHRSDIYSLGLVLFELLALQPARGKWSSNPLYAASRGLVDWDVLPRIPRRLKRLLDTMLAVEPENRYATTDDLAHDLEYYIYRKGYGPTVVTLERHLRELRPDLYRFSDT